MTPFESGFFKRAAQYNVSPMEAEAMYKSADWTDMTPTEKILVGAGTVGALGGGLGYLSGRSKDPKKDHRLRNTLGGAAIGFGGGAIGLAGATAGYYAGKDKDKKKES